ncbi:MAG: DUF3084 domain-containing protein [bacterium]
MLALISATVAYLGDVVGRQVAKKRISVAGIRPRRVGSYVAVITGIFIALATFLLLTLLSRDVRTWVFEYDRLKGQTAELQAEIAAATQAYDAAQARTAKLAEELQSKEAERSEIEGELAKSQTALDSIQSELLDKESKLRELQDRLDKNQKIIQDTAEKLETLQKEIAKLSGENESLSASKRELSGEIAALETTGKELEAANENLRKQAAQIESRIRTLEEVLGSLRTQNILIGAHQPLAYISIQKDWTGAQVREAIMATLGLLKQKLASKGYSLGNIPSSRLEELMSGLANATKDKAIVVSASQNVLPDDAVGLDFVVIDNSLCFRKDEVITRIEIPAGASREKVEELFATAIRNVRAEADKRNLLPNIDTGNVGSLNYDYIRNLISRIAKDGSAVTVEFVSTEDVYTLGNLDNLKIRYR